MKPEDIGRIFGALFALALLVIALVVVTMIYPPPTGSYLDATQHRNSP